MVTANEILSKCHHRHCSQQQKRGYFLQYQSFDGGEQNILAAVRDRLW